MKLTIPSALSMFGLFCLVGCNQTGSSIPRTMQSGSDITGKVDNSADALARMERERAEKEQAERERAKTSIESVLAQDSNTNVDAQNVTEVVERMCAIDTSECPADFRAAYLAHIHAWESMVEVEKSVAAFKADNPDDSVMIEAFLRGLLGDPLGKANELKEAQTQLQRDYQEAHTAIRDTFNRVEETAILYGATAPK